MTRDQRGRPQITVTDHFDGYFPSDYISPGASRIHGIKLDDLQTMDEQDQLSEWTDIGPRLLEHFRDADSVVGHNVAFDLRSIRDTLAYSGLTDESQEFEAIGRDKKNCTLQMARAWTKEMDPSDETIPKPPSHKLTALYQHIFDVDLTQAHDAAADTLATAALYYFLKGEDITAVSARPRPRTPKLAEPAERYNTPENSMSWLVVEHNHDRRHIIPKSLLKLFVNEGLKKFGGQALAASVLSHPHFEKMAESGLSYEAQNRLKHLADGSEASADTPDQVTADILYVFLKHNRFNYFLGESSWNRAIGAPMRYLRATESKTLNKINRSSKQDAFQSIISDTVQNLSRCLEGKHKDKSYNISFEDPRGSEVSREGKLAVQEMQESLAMINTAYTDTIQDHFDSGIPLKDIRKDVRGMIKGLQDTFAFDTSQSQNEEIRLTQNKHLSKTYEQLHQSIENNTLESFQNAMNSFLDLDEAISATGQIDADQVYDTENPVYAARQLNQLIVNHA